MRMFFQRIFSCITAIFLIISLNSCSSEGNSNKTSSFESSSQSSSQNQLTMENQNKHNYIKDNYMPLQYMVASDHSIQLIDFNKEQESLSDWLTSQSGVGWNSTVYLKKEGLLTTKYKITNEHTDYIYRGEIKDNYADGYGLLSTFSSDGIETYIYLGSFSKGQFNGYGLLFAEPDYMDSSSLYGLMMDADEETYKKYYHYVVNYVGYEGEFKDGKCEGDGNQYICNLYWMLEGIRIRGEESISLENAVSSISVGEFKDNERNGMVKRYIGGNLEYEGEMADDLENGEGIQYFTNGQIRYEGKFKNGEYHGIGTEYDENGNELYSGKWKNGDYA